MEFVGEPADEFMCPICLLVMRDPCLTSCCGSHFCQSCVDPLLVDGKPCPKCRAQGFTVLLNKHQKRKIDELEVECPKKSEGCDWVGPLLSVQKHLDTKCLYVEINCPNGCGECMTRDALEDHLESFCSERKYSCHYCGFEDSFKKVTERHMDVCPSYPLPCPNSCTVGTVDRCCLEHHLTTCMKQLVDCDFSHAGCTATVFREDLHIHMSNNVQSHLSLLASLTLKLSNQLESKDQQIATLHESIQTKDDQIATIKEEIRNLQRLVPVVPIEITMENFSALKNTNSEWNSPPFYSHENGYKMCLRVLPNGFQSCTSSHVSVYLCAVKGEFDDHLPWPVETDVRVLLLNQHRSIDRDRNGEHYERQMKCWLKRAVNRAIGGGQGRSDFILQSKLEYQSERDVQYLKFDRLNFRIASIQLHFRVTEL